MNISDLRFFKNITYQHAKTLFPHVDFDEKYPQCCNDAVAVFIDSNNIQYAQIIDYDDNDLILEMPTL